MAEALHELVVALSLDSSIFSRYMRTISQQIRNSESTFRLTGAGVSSPQMTLKYYDKGRKTFPTPPKQFPNVTNFESYVTKNVTKKAPESLVYQRLRGSACDELCDENSLPKLKMQVSHQFPAFLASKQRKNQPFLTGFAS